MNKSSGRFIAGRLLSIVFGLMTAGASVLGAAAQESTTGARWLAAPVAEVRAAAERGEAAAQHALGERLLRGHDGPADLLAAYEWFAHAGSNGVVEAQLRMGMKHERAVAGPRNIAEAARWYQLAVEKGSEAARFRLACVNSLNRHAGKLDAAEAVRWAQPLAERGHLPSVLLRAVVAPPQQAGPWVREAAQLGDVRLARRLSNMLAPTDAKEATYWDAVARAAGDTNVSFPLARAQGKMSRGEISAETDRAKDFRPKRAGFVPLGDLSPLHHIEVELQPTAAARAELARLEVAAQRGEAAAQFQLALVHQFAPAFTNHLAALDGGRRSSGSLLFNNDRVAQPHLEAAVRWHTAAAKQGHRDAALCLAWLQQGGVLGAPRIVDALPWLKVAADAGHAESAYQLFQFRLGGHGLEKTNDPQVKQRQYAETLGWLKRAAELNHLSAMTNHAARLYQSGDQAQALRFLRAAADRGDAGSVARLKEWFGLTHSTTAAPATPTASAVPAAKAAPGTPRLAVVPLAESLRPLADLLTVELSAKPGVALVERAELERVLREQNLNAANTSALKLGELLNAQGVLLLETNAAASARLVAVAPGVLLSGASIPLPLANASEWSRRLTAQFSPWLGKLAVARGAAVPVSLLGLRMATAATDGPEVEQGLSLLFLHRLTREREVFALERRRLEQLAAEQELMGATNSFWSGGALVDGAIERDLADRTRLTVRMQVTPAGAARVSFDVTGSTTNLAALADALAVKLLTALQRTPKGTWDPAEEAITFYQEAGWLARWGQWEPALAAMESAWALGLRGASHAQTRLQLLMSGLRFTGLRWLGTDEFSPLLRQPPRTENLELATRLFAAYTGHVRNLPPEALGKETPWQALGAAVLELSGRTLEEFYAAPEHRASRTEQLTSLRAEARALHAWLKATQTKMGTAGSWDKVGYQFRNTVLGERHGDVDLLRVEVAWLRYWAEQPSEVLELHQRLQARPDYDLWRGYFDNAKPTPLAAWSPAERAGLRAQWAAHLRELASATNLPGLFERELTAMRSVRTSPWTTAEPKLAAAMGKYLEFAWQQRDALVRHGAGAHTISSMLAACRERFAFYHGSTGHEPAGARLEALVAGHEKRLRQHQAEAGMAMATAFLKETKQENAQKFNDLVGGPNFTAAQARELLPLAQQHAGRFFHPPALSAGLRRLSELASPPATTNAPTAASVAANVPNTGTATPAPEPAVAPSKPAPDTLRVTRFWSGPELRRPVQSFFSYPLNAERPVYQRKLVVQDWLWSEDRLWVAWRHDLTGRAPGGFVFQGCSHVAGYALPDFAGDEHPDALPEPVQLPALFQPPTQQRTGRFAVVGGQLFVAGSNTVWRVAKGASAPLKLELVGEPVLGAAHGRLLISVPDELYLHDVRAGTTELLASARRRPGLNAADFFAQGHGHIAELPGGRMRVFFKTGAAFDYDFAVRTWTTLPGMQGTVHRIHADALEGLSTAGNGVFLSHLLPHAGTNWQLAAMRLPPPPRDVQAMSTGIRLPGVPRWYPADRELSPAWLGTTVLSNRFWTVTGLDLQRGSNSIAMRAATNGHHVRLAAWRHDLPQPAVIPLWLELPAGALLTGPEGRGGNLGQPAGVPGTLLATPPGLVYRVGPASGFWFIPWGDVLPRVETQFAQQVAARAARPNPGNHRGRQLLHTYDLDYSGKVEGGEFAALYSGEKLDADPNASRSLFSQFNNADRNRDGGLDGNELSAVGDLIRARSVPSSVQLPPRIGFGGPPFGPRQPGLPGQSFRPPSPFTQQPDLKQFDKNQDGRIDEEEGKAMQQFLQQQQAERMRPQQLPQGPPPPEILERYDKNKNGKMDPDEMQEFLRDVMSGKSPRPRGTNVPPGVPVPAPKAPPAKP